MSWYGNKLSKAVAALRMLERGIAEDPSWTLFCAFAFLSMLSMPLARIALAASLVCLLVGGHSRPRFKMSGPVFGWLCYFALAAIVTSAMAVANQDTLLVPAKGVRKLVKLAWFIAIPIAAVQVDTKERFRSTIRLLAAGGLLLALSILLFHTSFAWLQVNYPQGAPDASTPSAAAALYAALKPFGLQDALARALCAGVWEPWGGRPPCFYYALLFNATLHNAQRLMVALLASVALLLPPSGGRRWRLAVPVLIAAGLVVTCKRSALFASFIPLGFLLASRMRIWKAVAAVLAVAVLAVAVPQSRARLAMLPTEFNLKSGGRALMWTRIVPELHRQHPWGIGFRSLTDAKMRSIDRHVEPNRTHVHSTPLEAFVDFSWAGLAAWALWMALCFRSAVGAAHSGISPPAIAAFPLAAFFALFVVSLIEYNIGDAAVVLLYGTVAGMSTFRPRGN